MLSLIAAAPVGQNNKADDAAIAGLAVAMSIGLVLLVLVALAITICFLLSMSKALSRCRPRNRTMEPGHVWFMLIPCFNVVWQFFVVSRVPESIQKEYRSRGWRSEGDFGKGLGITFCILGLCSWIPYLGVLLSIAELVCFIVFWVKIAGYSKRLAEDTGDDYDDEDDRRDRDYDDEEEDERPRRRKKHYDDEDDDLR